MTRLQEAAIYLFGAGMIGLGALSVIYRDFAYSWQPVPAFHPGREALAVLCGLFMVAVGVGLLVRITTAVSVRAIFPFLIAWFCLKIPSVIALPRIEAVWLGLGEIGMLLAGGWMLFAHLSAVGNTSLLRHVTGTRGAHFAQILFGLSVLPVGMSHIFYVNITASLIPSWMPYRTGLAYFTGCGQILCGLAILLSIFARTAALIETAMLTLFAFLVWGPGTWIASTPKMAGAPAGARFPLTAFLITWIIAAATLLIAANAVPGRSSSKQVGR